METPRAYINIVENLLGLFGKLQQKISRNAPLADLVGGSENNWRYALKGLYACLEEEAIPQPSSRIAEYYAYCVAGETPRLTVGDYVQEIQRRRAPTMESPSPEKVAEMVGGLLQPVLKRGFPDLGRESYKLPKSVKNDQFILAYTYGALINGFTAADIKEPGKQEWGTMYFYYPWFPDDYYEVAQFCYKNLNDSDFSRIASQGRQECALAVAGEREFSSLVAHFESRRE